MGLRSLCIHGHFYQPPREDPLTGLIPVEPGAAPYENWNERVHAECYRPNAQLWNFGRISFNIGPTVYEWMLDYDAETCERIVAQDRANFNQYGVGNAIAQAYNHTILPLASTADKITQVAWGIAAFQHTFGRKPAGMWLPETAVDMETLGVLADQGIEFTILAPWQAQTAQTNPSEPYRVALPGNRSITVFFYQSELSSHVSFNPQATNNADEFVTSVILPRFQESPESRDDPQLLMIATDGELYGHHQMFRDHFLAHLVTEASAKAGISITFPALWLRDHPPRRSVSIQEKTSWSCHHGVMRWMGECSCTPGLGSWKVYLRRAFDRLAISLDEIYESNLQPLGLAAWDLRNRYIQVLLGETSVEDLIASASRKTLSHEDVRRVALLLEAQYERQRMYTSCGWFFEDFARIEPKNNVAYAAQAVWLTQLATGQDLSAQVMGDLTRVISQRSGLRGDIVFQRHLRRAAKFKPGFRALRNG